MLDTNLITNVPTTIRHEVEEAAGVQWPHSGGPRQEGGDQPSLPGASRDGATRHDPHLSRLRKLARVLGVKILELVD